MAHIGPRKLEKEVTIAHFIEIWMRETTPSLLVIALSLDFSLGGKSLVSCQLSSIFFNGGCPPGSVVDDRCSALDELVLPKTDAQPGYGSCAQPL